MGAATANLNRRGIILSKNYSALNIQNWNQSRPIAIELAELNPQANLVLNYLLNVRSVAVDAGNSLAADHHQYYRADNQQGYC